jgi:hypothetical protein
LDSFRIVGDAVCLGVAALLLGCELAVVMRMGYTRWASDYQLDASGYESVSDSQVLMCVYGIGLWRHTQT